MTIEDIRVSDAHLVLHRQISTMVIANWRFPAQALASFVNTMTGDIKELLKQVKADEAAITLAIREHHGVLTFEMQARI